MYIYVCNEYVYMHEQTELLNHVLFHPFLGVVIAIVPWLFTLIKDMPLLFWKENRLMSAPLL